MSVHVVDRALIVSDRSSHQARSVGVGSWVVTFLPGRTFSVTQATAAIQVADAAAEVEQLALLIGLTAREAFAMAMCDTTWHHLAAAESEASPLRPSRGGW